jgi:hypothetical protein
MELLLLLLLLIKLLGAARQQRQQHGRACPPVPGRARVTPAKRCRSAAAAATSGGTAEVRPRARLPMAAAAGVAMSSAQQLCSSDGEDDCQPPSKRLCKAADSDSYSRGAESTR